VRVTGIERILERYVTHTYSSVKPLKHLNIGSRIESLRNNLEESIPNKRKLHSTVEDLDRILRRSLVIKRRELRANPI
jgi:hypothetical protein